MSAGGSVGRGLRRRGRHRGVRRGRRLGRLHRRHRRPRIGRLDDGRRTARQRQGATRRVGCHGKHQQRGGNSRNQPQRSPGVARSHTTDPLGPVQPTIITSRVSTRTEQHYSILDVPFLRPGPAASCLGAPGIGRWRPARTNRPRAPRMQRMRSTSFPHRSPAVCRRCRSHATPAVSPAARARSSMTRSWSGTDQAQRRPHRRGASGPHRFLRRRSGDLPLFRSNSRSAPCQLVSARLTSPRLPWSAGTWRHELTLNDTLRTRAFRGTRGIFAGWNRDRRRLYPSRPPLQSGAAVSACERPSLCTWSGSARRSIQDGWNRPDLRRRRPQGRAVAVDRSGRYERPEGRSARDRERGRTALPGRAPANVVARWRPRTWASTKVVANGGGRAS